MAVYTLSGIKSGYVFKSPGFCLFVIGEPVHDSFYLHVVVSEVLSSDIEARAPFVFEIKGKVYTTDALGWETVTTQRTLAPIPINIPGTKLWYGFSVREVTLGDL